MKNILIVCSIISLLMFSSIVIAQELPKIKTIVHLGKGIAISTTDSKDFRLLKVGIATVTTRSAGEESELRVGVLVLDDVRYKLKDIQVGNGTISGSVYLNDTSVGSFEASSIMKGDLEVWVGTLSISGASYNVYILEAPRPIKPRELGEHISETCKGNPERCKVAIKGIGPANCEKTPEEPSCRERIKNFCENNPKDQRCVALFRVYCMKHLDDARCREAVKEVCKENKDDERCRMMMLKTSEIFCQKNPLDKRCVELEKNRIADYCINNPDDVKCAKVKTVKEFVERAKDARFCKQNPTAEKCQEFCELHPRACRTPPSVNETGGQ